MKRFLVIVIFFLWAAPLHAMVCAKDLNGDGNLDSESEVATCASVQGKDFCPIGAVDCNETSSDPTCPETGGTLCPSSGTYNAAMSRCELPPVITSYQCPATGSTYEDQSVCQNACLQSGTCSQHGHQNGPYYCQVYAGGTANVCDQQYCQISGGGWAPCPPGVDPTYSGSNCPGVSLTYWGETYYWGSPGDYGCWGHWSRVWYYYNTIYHWTCSLTGTEYGDSGTCSANCTQGSACTARYGCPSGYQMVDNICTAVPIAWPAASFNPSNHLCETIPVNQQCPSPYAYNSVSQMCEGQPVCSTGTFTASTNKCLAGYTCPLGSQYECLPNPATGVMQCSPNSCFDPALQPTEVNEADLKNLHDDAQVDQTTGECLGTILIFNGKPSECKTAGVSTSFFNCCDTDEGSLGPIRERCGDGDAMTVQAAGAGRCHYVGDYCQEEWPLIGCVQRANTYCCFNSKLGRIIHEQGRPQLQQFAGNGGWGGAESPNCRGFTPEEFQMLDFSRIDLSEYFGDIRTKATQEVQQNMEGKVREYYQNIR